MHIQETSGDEYILGLGYRLQDVRFRTSIGGRRVVLRGDLNIKADVSYRDNITVLAERNPWCKIILVGYFTTFLNAERHNISNIL